MVCAPPQRGKLLPYSAGTSALDVARVLSVSTVEGTQFVEGIDTLVSGHSSSSCTVCVEEQDEDGKPAARIAVAPYVSGCMPGHISGSLDAW